MSRALAVIDVTAGMVMESQSGLYALRPRIFGAYEEPRNKRRRTAALVMHPTSNFMGHYLIAPLARRGICCLGLNSRYSGNDAQLIMETVLSDVGVGVKFLRGLGYERVMLIGNSGGGALMAFYQAQAEHLTAHHTPAGDPTYLQPDDVPAADAIVLNAAHAGRAALMREWIDPSVINEYDPLATDPELDVYDPANGPPYDTAFVQRFRAAQSKRLQRIESWCLQRLRDLRQHAARPHDQVFLMYRTHADPRFLDLSIDANDRAAGSIWGDARAVNYGANAMGRFSSCASFLSQWSSRSQADGPENLARTSVPVLLFEHTADGSTYPSTNARWRAAGGDRIEAHALKGANHYLHGQGALVEQLADRMSAWVDAKLS